MQSRVSLSVEKGWGCRRGEGGHAGGGSKQNNEQEQRACLPCGDAVRAARLVAIGVVARGELLEQHNLRSVLALVLA
eukprot:5137158-Prymnesium_polylepis.1